MRRIPAPDVSLRIAFLVTFILGLLVLLTRTWQFAFLAGFVGGMLVPRARRAFAVGALGVGLGWLGYLAYLFVEVPGQALSALFVSILGLSPDLWWLLPAMTVLLGLLTGGSGALVGHYGARLFTYEPTRQADAPKD